MDLEQGHGQRATRGRATPVRTTAAGTGVVAGLAGPAALLSVPPVLGRLILGTCIAFLILGVLPASFVFWLCLMLLAFTCLRIRLQAQQLQQALEQTQEEQAMERLAGPLAAGGRLGSSGAFVRLIPGGGGLLLLHTDPRAAIERINMQLRALDEEVGMAGVADYDALLRMGHTGPLHPAAILHGAGLARAAVAAAAPPALSDEDIAALPSHPYKAPPRPSSNSGSPDAAVLSGPGQPQHQHMHQHPAPTAALPEQPSAGAPPSMAAAKASQQQQQQQPLASSASLRRTSSGLSPRHAVSQQARRQAEPAASASAGVGGAAAAQAAAPSGGAGGGGGGEHDGLTCSVCLDQVADGQMVTTLPCLHQFHSACINPWLRRKGLHASCPLCKTPVFR
ncbi:hypothetical protein HXX76_000380 [Chlamydomonas incerta]|uniref:RING-type E3 ubiquitin transferase n=1 Tax=Chlamydomonas incerta TaxID=51695 RepID=A0A836B2H6_CHLIN|nr:hypothetical protein HXX76_000380 [Chlamydomonas incerta]|eukprot:KAG2445776.1 hypothetical protein HXX76_000380 [Chlamydomonas incerta]